MMGYFSRACLLALLLLAQGSAKIDVLQIRVPPSNASAGTIWSPAPVVEAMIRDGRGQLTRDISANGIMYAVVDGSVPPSVKLAGSQYAEASIAAGVATFNSLFINETGWHSVRFFVDRQAQIVSPAVYISAGPPQRFVVTTQPGLATGGRPFSAQPVVAVVDAGGNIVTAAHNISITVALHATPQGVQLTPHTLKSTSGSFTAVTVAGVARFEGLYLDRAGDGYMLNFTANGTAPDGTGSTNTAAPGSSYDLTVYSRSFTVGVGPAAGLSVSVQPGGARGGQPFAVQPVVEVVDAGGNVATADSYSTVTALIYANPAGGTLSPAYIRRRYPASIITGSVVRGQEYVQLSADPQAVLVAAGPSPFPFPPLRSGDRIALGGPAPGEPPTTNTVAEPGAAASGAWVNSGSSTMAGDSNGVYPGVGEEGVLVRSVRPPSELRLRLHAPWQGPTMTNAVLTRVERAAVRPVIAGRAVFEGLRLDRVGQGYSLLFISSMINASDPAAVGNFSATDYGAGELESPTWVGRESTIWPFGLGYGAVGPGFGFGGPSNTSGSGGSSGVLPGRLTGVSSTFNVEYGEPAQLVLVRAPGLAWAGGQPFGVQPVVAVTDAGGNILTPRNDDIITASLLTGDVASNAAGAFLTGSRRVRLEEGTAEWVDLGVSKPSWPPGNPYTLLFSANIAGYGYMELRVNVSVAFSAEYMVSPFLTNATAAAVAVGNAREWAAGLRGPAVTGAGATRAGAAGFPAAADRFGHAVAVTDSVAAVSALYRGAPRAEVQVVRTVGGAAEYQQEVQVITLSAPWRPEIQSITTSAAAGEALGGSFTLAWGGETSRAIPANAHEDYVKAVIEEDLMRIAGGEDGRGTPGQVAVARVDASAACGCRGAWRWLITFDNVYGPQPLFVSDGSGLTGAGAAVTVAREQEATVIGGSFRLAIPQPTSEAAGLQTAEHSNLDAAPSGYSSHPYTTSWLPFDVAAHTLAAALQNQLLTGPVAITTTFQPYSDDVVNGYSMGVRTWSITFPPSQHSYDVPTLQPDASRLTGHGAYVYIYTAAPGKAPLGGTFMLRLRDVATPPILWNATAAEMRRALLATRIAVEVDVTRSPPLAGGGYAWIVTFHQLAHAPAGSLRDAGGPGDAPLGSALVWDAAPTTTSPIPGTTASSNNGSSTGTYAWIPYGQQPAGVMLTGSDGAGVEVTAVNGSPQSQPWKTQGAVGGSAGAQAGGVYLFARLHRTWVPHAFLQASDASELDYFGHSLSLSSGLLAVGAPGWRDNGEVEVQTITCRADGGSFTVTHGGRTSPAIAWDADSGAVRAALEALPQFLHIVATPARIATDRACADVPGGRTMRITFMYPQDGDVEPLEVDAASLTLSTGGGGGAGGAVLYVSEAVKGTRVSAGPNATQLLTGAAYVFESASVRGAWYQSARLPDPARRSGDQFGWAVAVTANGGAGTAYTLAVGAPGDVEDGGFDAGAVYIYNRHPAPAGTPWNLTQKLLGSSENSVGGAGFRFGWALAFSGEGDTLAIGAPGANSGGGAIYVFKRQQDISQWFFIDQVFAPLPQSSSTPAQLGYSLAFSSNVLVAGAPGATSTTGSNAGADTGCGYIYDRVDWGNTAGGYLSLRTVACPEAAAEGDRVGLSVAAADDTVLLGGVGAFEATANNEGVAGSVGAGSAGPSQLYPSGRPQYEVQVILMQMPADAGENATIAGTWALQWRARTVLPPAATAGAGTDAAAEAAAEAGHSGSTGTRTDTHSSARGQAGIAGVRQLVTSRRLPWNAGARAVRAALEQDLAAGRVRVSRMGPGAGGAYSWSVTFLQSAPSRLGTRSGVAQQAQEADLPLLRVRSFLRLETAADPAAVAAGSATAQAAANVLLHPYNRLSPTVLESLQGGRGARAAAPLPLLTVVRTNSPPLPVRGAAYIYTREASVGYGDSWVAQAALAPHAYQAADQYGFSAALSPSGAFALIGSPARDVTVDGAASLNTGAAFAYHLDFLNFRFTPRMDPDDVDSVQHVDEGGAGSGRVSQGHHDGLGLASTVDVTLATCSPTCHVAAADVAPLSAAPGPAPSGGIPQHLAYVTSVAGNDWGFLDLHAPPAAIPPPGAVARRAHRAPAMTVVGAGGSLTALWRDAEDVNASVANAGNAWAMGAAGGQQVGYWHTAHAGAQPDASACSAASVGRPDCHFLRLAGPAGVLGGYDYAGIQDFVAITQAVAVAADTTAGALPATTTFTITVHDDAVVETPDELFHVRLSLPGMWPLWGGRLWTSVRIADEGDGTVGSQTYTAVMHGTGTSAVAADPPEEGVDYAFGSSIAFDGRFAVVGAPTAPVSGASAVGQAQILRLRNGVWGPVLNLPRGTTIGTTANGRFGDGVALYSHAGSNARWAVVGAPGVPAAAVYKWDATKDSTANDATSWTLEATLLPDVAGAAAVGILTHGSAPSRPVDGLDGFGSRGTIAIFGDGSAGGAIVAVGCAGLEAVFLYRNTRTGTPHAGGATVPAAAVPAGGPWELTLVLRPADYAETSNLGMLYPVPTGFGSAVAAHGSTLVVGAPQGNYAYADTTIGGRSPPAAPTTAEAAETASGYGTGAVRVYQWVGGVSTEDYGGDAKFANRWADLADWPAGDAAIAAAAGAGAAAAAATAVTVHDDGVHDSVWIEHVVLIAPAARAGEQYGAALALHGTTLAVSAPGHAGTPGSTWDFETGDLRGWTLEGDAFSRQPVFGDNTAARPGYPTRLGAGAPQSSRHRGRYWVGSYEARPADLPPASVYAADDVSGHAGETRTGQPMNWQPADVVAGSSLTPGSVQGDKPRGSMTSQPFRIAGPQMSFLVGGGCDERAVWVELLVDGVRTLRATGACSEDMRRVYWDLSAYRGRAGQVRIVDDSSVSPWGHINVDDFRFAWDIGRFAETGDAGAVFVYRRISHPAAAESGHVPSSSEPYASAPLSRPQAGTGTGTGTGAPSPTAQPRNVPLPVVGCASSQQPLSCAWQLEAQLLASDKRPGARFGHAVAVDEDAGVLLISAVGGTLHTQDWHQPGSAAGADVVHEFLRSAAAARRRLAADGGFAATSAAGATAASAAALAAAIGVRPELAYVLYGRASFPDAVTGTAVPPSSLQRTLLASAAAASDGNSFGATTAGVGIGGLDAAGYATLAGGSGSASATGGVYGSGSGLSSGLGARYSDNSQGGNPFAPSDADAAAGAGAGAAPTAPGMLSTGAYPAVAPGLAYRRFSRAAADQRDGGATGVVYVYRCEPEVRAGLGQLLRPRRWPVTATALLDVASRGVMYGAGGDGVGGQFGGALALSGFTALVGSPGDSRLAPRGGTVTALDLTFLYLSLDPAPPADPARQTVPQNLYNRGAYPVGSFGASVEHFTVKEGTVLREIAIPVYRHSLQAHAGTPLAALLDTRTIHVHYATRDITAQGVSEAEGERCAKLYPRERSQSGCGDYVQQAGELAFPPGTTRQDIIIKLLDDHCSEGSSEAFALQLYIPGGVALRGYGYSVVVTVDDDDDALGTQFCGSSSSSSALLVANLTATQRSTLVLNAGEELFGQEHN